MAIRWLFDRIDDHSPNGGLRPMTDDRTADLEAEAARLQSIPLSHRTPVDDAELDRVLAELRKLEKERDTTADNNRAVHLEAPMIKHIEDADAPLNSADIVAMKRAEAGYA